MKRFFLWLHSSIKKMFSLDVRSLALFRIGISTILFWNLYTQITNVSAFYTDTGVLPRSLLNGNFGIIDVYALSGNLWFQIVLIIISAVVYIAFLVGFQTRIATIITWILVISVQNRNPLITHLGDDLLRMLLFWSIFLPIGDYYSIDSFKKNPTRKTYQVFSMAGVAFIIQMFIVYFFGALLKSGIQWHQQGTAVYYSLRLEQYTTSFTSLLLSASPFVLIFLTHAILLMEIIVPFLFFFPIFSQQFRIYAIFLFICLHLGLGMFLNLETFTWIPIWGLLAMLPMQFWNILVAFFKKYHQQKLTIYYDDDCGFCKRSVFFLKAIFFLYDIQIFSAQTNTEIYRKMQEHNSWVIKDRKGKLFFKANGFAKILSISPVFFFLAPLILWKPMNTFANMVYKYTAEHRTLFCTLPQIRGKKEISLSTVAINIIVMICLLFVFFWNIALLPNVHIRIPMMVFSVAKTLRIDQDWIMFAPNPPTEDGWFVAPALLTDGTTVDLYTQQQLTWEKPISISDLYPDKRWHMYLVKLRNNGNEKYYPYFLSYLCNRWNTTHNSSSKAVSVRLYFMRKEVPLPFADINTPVDKISLLSQECKE